MVEVISDGFGFSKGDIYIYIILEYWSVLEGEKSQLKCMISGQIIATSHDLTPHGRVVGEPCLKWPYFREIQVGEIL